MVRAKPLLGRIERLEIDDKRKGTDTPSANSVPPSPGPVVNQLDDSTKETFATGRPLEDSPELQTCKHCKKTILRTAAKTHVVTCLKAKREKAQRKKEAKEARERERKAIDGENKKDDDGDTRMDDDDDDDDAPPEKKVPGGIKSAKKSAGKKVEIDDLKKGKKRKADGDAEKGPKLKKKKEEPKPKAAKPKGILSISYLSLSHFRALFVDTNQADNLLHILEGLRILKEALLSTIIRPTPSPCVELSP